MSTDEKYAVLFRYWRDGDRVMSTFNTKEEGEQWITEKVYEDKKHLFVVDTIGNYYARMRKGEKK